MMAATAEVDVPTARELIEQVHQHVSVEEIEQLVGELERKSIAIRQLIAGPEVDAARLRAALDWSFVARRRTSGILGARGDAELAAWVRALLSDEEPRGRRLQRFCAHAGSLSGTPAAVELGSELLHFCAPRHHGLWSRWVWSPQSRTGALALLIGENYELEADGVATGYERVCEALAVVDASPEALSFRGRSGGGPFGTDVLLACTYGVYMRTVLGLKMTQEFNALVPPMPQLVRRLLGTHHHKLEASR